MKLIDMHCDTISVLHESKENVCLRENNFHVDLQKLKKANSKAQFFALFTELEEIKEINQQPYEYVNNMLNRFNKEIEENKELIALARSYDEMQENEKNNKISAFLTIEEGEVLEGSLDNLKEVYDKGVRLITLTWNYANTLGYPNCKKEFMNKGLTKRGIEVVEMMNELGMIVDVSHLSDGGFYDVLKHSKKPFVASHSNARSITNHSRNLTDEMIKYLANNGGVMGLNFCAPFLSNDKVTRVKYMIEHLKHIRNVGGVDVMAMGTDFDGIGGELEIANIGEIDKLIVELKKSGFKEDEIDKIWHKNAERVIKEVLK